MTTTFTQVRLELQFDTSVLEEVASIVSDMVGENPNKVLTIDSSIHGNSTDKGNELLGQLEELKDLGAIGHNKEISACDQERAFKRVHMR